MKRITVANQKGGLGKTAISTNLARYFASYGAKVLFLDLDIQGNASFTLEKYNCEYTACDLLTKRLEHMPSNIVPYELCDGSKEGSITLAMASKDLATLDFSKRLEFRDNFEHNLREFNYFDMIIIDTPPTLSDSLGIALQISHNVFVPIEPDIFSLRGLEKLLTTISNARSSMDNRHLRTMGVCFSRVAKGRPRPQNYINDLKKKIGGILFEPVIYYRDSVAEALNIQTDIRLLAKNKTAARKAKNEFEQVFLEVARRINYNLEA